MFLLIGRGKIGCSKDDHVCLVLESDGTHVDDEEYFRCLPDNTAFLLLRPGEAWTLPSKLNYCVSRNEGFDCWRSSETAIIPRAVSDALTTLEIYREPSFWKIVDNHGKITLVLHWDQLQNNHVRYVGPARSQEAYGNSKYNGDRVPMFSSHSLDVEVKPRDFVTVVDDKRTPVSTSLNVQMKNPGVKRSSASCANLLTKAKSKLEKELNPNALENSIPLKGDTAFHTSGFNREQEFARSSASQHSLGKCEFHCGSLHEEGRSIRSAECHNPQPSRSMSKIIKSSHVHFCDEALETVDSTVELENGATVDVCRSSRDCKLSYPDNTDSETDKESCNTAEDEFESEGGVTSEKLLLLTDQLSNDKHKHLTILDLGVILERLKAKIIDVHRLEREREDPHCFRWNINATIRGEVLRDLGVLYNGNYYSISESTIFLDPSNGFRDEEED